MRWLPDWRRVAGVLVVLCLGVAIGTIVFGSGMRVLSPSGQLLEALEMLAYLLPVAGLLLVAAVIRIALQSSSMGRDQFINRTTGGVTEDSQPVGRDIGRRLERAASDWYRCEESYSVTDIRERLRRSALRALKTETGIDDERAHEALEEGTWTDDSVAAAFLSPRRTQPLGERCKGILDPGRAFDRRVDRTLDAIEALETASARQPTADQYGNTDSARGSDAGPSEEVTAK